MPSPELRCLECNRQFADLTADQEVERCAECGKFVVAAPTLLTLPVPPASAPTTPTTPLVDLTAENDIPTVGKAKPAGDDLPLAQPVKAPPPPIKMPDWARRDDEDEPAPPAPPKAADPFRPALPSKPAAPPPAPRATPTKWTEQPADVPPKKPKIGLALFVALLFLLMMLGAIGVLGYVVIRGLKMRKVITQADPPAVVVVHQPDAFNRSSVS